MKNFDEDNSFLNRVNSIQEKFMESLITGRRDPIFGAKGAAHKPKSEEEATQAYVDSQRGTF